MKRTLAIGFTVQVLYGDGMPLRTEEFKTLAEALDRFNLINGKAEMAFQEGRRTEYAEAPQPKYPR